MSPTSPPFLGRNPRPPSRLLSPSTSAAVDFCRRRLLPPFKENQYEDQFGYKSWWHVPNKSILWR
ncbi:hypothetical protein Ccrd_024950 [Cynara cardunculus var. scolymus]|uniref:Uncharacterized protein n=1 Tax=Cynara cardunculus var. scolymus TaxID=59895 RepID=A0A103XBP5_CYNCS|nr:hypothetical protein Ccrd_024950 [Cynara cardunculus var. scolymus]